MMLSAAQMMPMIKLPKSSFSSQKKRKIAEKLPKNAGFDVLRSKIVKTNFKSQE